MELPVNVSPSTAPPTTAQNDTTGHGNKYTSHNWEFLVAVLATAVSVSIILALLAKCQVVRRYLASYRHTRLREGDSGSQCDAAGLEGEFALQSGRGIEPHSLAPEGEEDDDGFIEDNYIPASERARAERAAEILEDTDDTEDELDEIQFSIA